MKREKGTGSLYQAKDKSWVYQYQEGGKRKTKRFPRKADAKVFMEALAAQKRSTIVVQGSRPSGEIMTVGEWMDRWLEKYPLIVATKCISGFTSNRSWETAI